MKEQWKDAIVTDISVALYVPSGAGIKSRNKRPFHGFVLNDPEGSAKEYHFSGGQVMRMEAGEMCYLPKDACYRVESVSSGGCWVIDFDLLMPLQEEPFVVSLNNLTEVQEIVEEAVAVYQIGGQTRDLAVRKALYSIILLLLDEQNRNYVPNSRMQLLLPVLDRINSSFADRELTVHALAAQCKVSDTYFRRIFGECIGISPQEYIIDRRLQYAKQLLKNGQFSVSEIAQMCGYIELSHFSREFTKRVGVSPKTFSKTIKAE